MRLTRRCTGVAFGGPVILVVMRTKSNELIATQIFEDVMDWCCENIIQGNLDVEKVRETDLIIAFKHTKPFWEHHIVVVPKKHIESLAEPEAADADLICEIMNVLHELAVEFKAKWGGCHVGTNVGTYQSTKHLHWYIH